MSLRCTVCNHLHSNAQGDALTRGGFTITDGAGSRPALIISLTPRGKGAEVAFIWLRRSQVARLQTNFSVSSTNVSESLRPSDENITIGGSVDTPLKKEYGARLISPLARMEEIHPIGRGAMIALNGSWGRPWFFLRGS